MILGAIALPIIILAALWVLQSWWLLAVVRPRIEQLTGLSFDANELRLTLDGRLIATRAKLHAADRSEHPTVQATAVKARLAWRKLLAGEFALYDIALNEPVIRINSDTIAPLTERSPMTRIGSIETLPEMRIIDGTVEFTENNEVVVSVTGEGSIVRRPGGAPVYDVALRQTGAGEPVTFTGWIDLSARSANFTAGDVAFTEWIEAFSIRHEADFWRSILTGGRLVAAEVEYSPETGVVSHLDIENVRLALPTPSDGEGEGERLVLEGVGGRIFLKGSTLRANLAGLIDGLPTAATLETTGLSLTSPFRCDLVGGPFMIDQHWRPLTLAPPFVQRLLSDFSGPSAEIVASIELTRSIPSVAIEEGVSVAGEVRVKHGRATFIEFPYPILDVAGTVRFDDRSVRMLNLTGVGLSGAQLRGEGIVTTADDNVSLDLMIWGDDAPIDTALLDALAPDERAVLESLFHDPSAAELQSAGLFASVEQKQIAEATIAQLTDSLSALVATGDEAAASLMRASIAEWRSTLDRPTFEVGGRIDVQARVQWSDRSTPRHQVDVDVHFDRAGIVYEGFPYPVTAAPLDARIDRSGVTIQRAPIAGLTGARGEITGAVQIDRHGAQSNLRISFDEMPVDEALMQAVEIATEQAAAPTRRPAVGSEAPERITIGNALRRLGAGGRIQGEATIRNANPDELTWRVDIPLKGLTLRSAGADAVEVADFDGDLVVSPEGWRVNQASAMLAASPISFSIEAPADQPPVVKFQSDALNLSTKVEHFIREFDADAAEAIAEARRLAALEGVVAVMGEASLAPDDPHYELQMTGLDELSLVLDGRSARVAPRSGQVQLRDGVIIFEDVGVELLDHLGGSSGVVAINGAVGVGAEIEFKASNLAIETPLVDAALRSLNPSFAVWIDRAMPAGRFDAALTIASGGDGALTIVDGVVEPRSLRFASGRERIAIDDISGSITLGPGGGEVRQLQLRAADWSAHLNGDWYSGATPGVDLQVTARGNRLGDDILALLPHDVRGVFETLNIRVDGGFELIDASLAVNAPIDGQDLGDGFRDGVRFSGAISCKDAAIDAGVAFTGISGDVLLNAWRPPHAATTEIDVRIELAAAQAAGLTVDNLTASVVSSDERPEALRIELLGASHGGRMWGEGEIQATGQSGSPGSYRFDLRLAGLDLATAMHEFSRDDQSLPTPEIGERGHVDASIVLAGDLTADSAPRGAGELRILGGELARLPLVMTVLQLGNLIPPIGEKLDYARADFSLRDNVATFDRLLVVSPSMALVGEGDITIPEFKLDLRFGASGNYRLPIFSSIFDVLRNEILTTRVRGTLAQPEFSLEQLSATRRLFSRVFGGADEQGEPRQDEKAVVEVDEPLNDSR